MIQWKPLTSESQLDDIIKDSFHKSILVFKHSTSCSISAIAKMRLEEAWDLPVQDIDTYLLDLLSFRSVSSELAERFSVYHESPQILLIKDGECFHDASHFDVNINEVKEVI